MISEALVLAGALLTLLAGVGVVRFPDVFTRMHSLTKASALGFLLTLLGAATALRDFNAVTSLVLAALLQLVTLPVGSNLLAQSTYRVARAVERAPSGPEDRAGPPAAPPEDAAR